MIWLTWRQHRIQVVIYLFVLSLISAGLLILGFTARNRASTLGIPQCLKDNLDCSDALSKLSGLFHSIPPFTGLLIVMPVLVGMFIASPLLPREYEQGTHRFVWTQSISPRQWLTTKVVMIFGVVALASALVGALTKWALSPLMPGFGGLFNSTWYDIQGVVPVSCTIFASSLGLAMGALLRRSIPALATTLAIYVAVRIPIHWIRGSFFSSKTITADTPLTSLISHPYSGLQVDAKNFLSPNDWLLSTVITNPDGSPTKNSQANIDILHKYCPDLVDMGRNQNKLNLSENCRNNLEGLSLHTRIKFQPSNHFWIIQFVESAIFLGVSALLVGATIYVIGGRRSPGGS